MAVSLEIHRRNAKRRHGQVSDAQSLLWCTGAPDDVPIDQCTPVEVSAYMQFMQDFADQLQASSEFVDGQSVSPEGTFVRYDGEGRPPVPPARSLRVRISLLAGW